MNTTVILTAPEAMNAGEDDDFPPPAVNDSRPRWMPPAKPQKGRGSDVLPGETYNLLIRQAVAAIPHTESTIEASRTRAAAMEMLEALDPRDAIEGMICVQMIGLHNVTMECMRRAAHINGPERETALQQMNKASRTLGTLVETLNKHRGKGRQTMVVEHVHVHQGGQAIVGQVGGTISKAGANPER
jgi:hypothetical protein